MLGDNPERVAVFIDNSNVYKHLDRLKKIDPNWICLYNPLELAQKLAGNRTLVGTYFYCSPPPTQMLKTVAGKDNYSIQTKYYAEIQKLGGVELKFGSLQGSGLTLTEKNLDTQLTSNMVVMAAKNDFDTAILVSNDADYLSAIQPVKDFFSKKVEILYFKGSISNSLLQIADVVRKARRVQFVKLRIPA